MPIITNHKIVLEGYPGFSVRDEMKTEIREEIALLRSEIAGIRTEMHDMNGRLGRAEGLLRAPDAG